MGGVGGLPMIKAVHSAHGAQINFGDLTPYLKVHKIEIFFGFDFEICIIS